jgi:hypothetical protein
MKLRRGGGHVHSPLPRLFFTDLHGEGYRWSDDASTSLVANYRLSAY